MSEKIKKILNMITPIDEEAMELTKKKWDTRTHPIGSLGKLEDMTIRLGGIQGGIPKPLDKRAIVVMSADNGIFEENISSSPQEFTYMLTNAMADGQTGVSSLGAAVNADVAVVDIGVIPHGDFHPNVIRKTVREGSENFLKKPALTKEEVIKGIETGIEIAEDYISKGVKILGTGELGIANTTTSSAVMSAITGLDPARCVGLGGGITSEQLKRKEEVIREGLALHKPDPKDAVDVLAKVGGLDICGLTGVFLAGAAYKIPVVIDGIISSVAALCAKTMAPHSVEYFFGSHLSKEAAAGLLLEEIGVDFYVNLDMRLGEGSGCPFTFAIFDMAIYALNHMGSFDSTQIENTLLVNIRDKEEQ